MWAPKTILIGLAPATDMALDTGPGIGAGRWDTMVDPTVLWDLAGTVVMGDLAQRVRRQVCPEHVLLRHLTRLRNSGRSIERPDATFRWSELPRERCRIDVRQFDSILPVSIPILLCIQIDKRPIPSSIGSAPSYSDLAAFILP